MYPILAAFGGERRRHAEDQHHPREPSHKIGDGWGFLSWHLTFVEVNACE
jgi:hypothetical protein